MAPKKLTVKQEAFILAYLETADEHEAYRLAYDADRMTHATLHKEAKKLMEHPQIAPRLKKIDLHVQAKGLRSIEDHISKLEELRDFAKENGQSAAAIKAEELIGKVSRLYVIQVETGGPGDFANWSDEELVESIKDDLREMPAFTTRH